MTPKEKLTAPVLSTTECCYEHAGELFHLQPAPHNHLLGLKKLSILDSSRIYTLVIKNEVPWNSGNKGHNIVVLKRNKDFQLKPNLN
ncbi:MAG TPA: hypothetical protein DCP92_04135 [Nitrospiraceae bacterium]|nr:hypothetical protein [Nitrospiraceae bacterium]